MLRQTIGSLSLVGVLMLGFLGVGLCRCAMPNKAKLKVGMTETEAIQALGGYQIPVHNAVRQLGSAFVDPSTPTPRYWVIFDRNPAWIGSDGWNVKICFNHNDQVVSWEMTRRHDYITPRWLDQIRTRFKR